MKKTGCFWVFEGVSGSGKTSLLERTMLFFKNSGVLVISNEEPTVHNSFGKIIREIIERRTPPKTLIKEVENYFDRFTEEMNRLLNSNNADTSVIKSFCAKVLASIEKIKKGEKLLSRELQMFYVVDRYFDLHDFILPYMEKGYWVFNDRFLLSTFAYGGAYGVNIEEVYNWHLNILGHLMFLPNITFFIKVSGEIASERLFGSGKIIDIWEKKGKLQSLIDHYNSSISFIKNKATDDISNSFHFINGELDKEGVFQEVKNILGTKFEVSD